MTKQQQLIAMGATAVVVLGGAAYFFLSKGSAPATDTTTPTTPPPATTAQAGAPMGAAGPQAGVARARPGTKAAAAGPKTPGAPNNKGIFANAPAGPGKTAALNAAQAGGAAAGAPGQPGAAAKPAAATTTIAHVSDPFYISWHKIPPPPNVFDRVQPIVIASADVSAPPPPNTEVREVPNRRVSGIMTGDGVYAILEGSSEGPQIVKPGSVTSDGYRVVSINEDSVRLQKRDGNILYTQVVPLSDAGAAAVVPAAAGGFGGGFNPGFPTGGGTGGFRRGGGGSSGGKID